MQHEEIPAHYWISRTVMNLCYAGFCVAMVFVLFPPAREAAVHQLRQLQYLVALEQWKRRTIRVPQAWREAWMKPGSDLPDEQAQ